MSFIRIVIVAVLVCGIGCARHDDLILINADIWTNDPDRPVAREMRVCNGVVREVGEHVSRECPEAKGRSFSRQTIVDAGGRRVVPGLIDAHLHLVSGGRHLSQLDLRDVTDRAAFIAAIAGRARSAPKGQWITGGRWSTESWPDPAQPTRQWIDADTADHPVLLSRMDGHSALANGAALAVAGITADGPPDPPGGVIERDPATGGPTGILRDAAIELVARHVPPPSDRELDAALVAAMTEAHRHGITAVHTMSPWSELAVIDRARRRGKLTLRVRFYVSEDDWREYLDRASRFRGDDLLRVCGFKQYADGSLGSRTAYMAEPYADNPPDKPDWRGLLREVFGEKGRLESLVRTAAAAGFGSAIHAIGDQANQEVLGVYEAVQAAAALSTAVQTNADRSAPDQYTAGLSRKSSSTGSLKSEISNSKSVASDICAQHPEFALRLRIEHAQHLLPADIERFARMGVVASMQPLHKADDARYAEQAIGKERCKTSYAFRSLLDAGAHVAFGSDWPVVSINPFLGMHAAVTARSLDGRLFVPEQSIGVTEALRCYTSGAAYASGDESRLGRLAPGFLADFAILERDPFAAAPDDLRSITVKATYVGGRRVWTK